jgi:Icc-related predicted phosphoesterase
MHMKILFVGDVHGRIYHLLTLARRIQTLENHQVACIVQVGDMGAFPSADRVDAATLSFAATDPSELDFVSFMNADPHTLSTLATLRKDLGTSVWFVRGDHEDHHWLDSLSEANPRIDLVPVDPLGIVNYIPDFRTVECCGLKIGFASGIEASPDQRSSRQSIPHGSFSTNGQALDILVTHHPPYGVSAGYKGQLQGSRYVTELIHATEPRFHFFGHLHQTLGPFRIGKTLSTGLSQLVQPLRHNPQQDLLPGSLGLFDIEAESFLFLMDEWLSDYTRHMKLPELSQMGG